MVRLVRIAGALACMPLGSSHLERPKLSSASSYHDLRARHLPVAQLPSLPWHGANVVGNMFGGRPICPMLAPLQAPSFRHVPRDTFVTQKLTERVASTVLTNPAKARKLTPDEDDSVKKRRLVRKWISFVQKEFPGSSLGIELQQAEDPFESMRHTLFNKSANTLAQRLAGLNSLLSRWKKHHKGYRWGT